MSVSHARTFYDVATCSTTLTRRLVDTMLPAGGCTRGTLSPPPRALGPSAPGSAGCAAAVRRRRRLCIARQRTSSYPQDTRSERLDRSNFQGRGGRRWMSLKRHWEVEPSQRVHPHHFDGLAICVRFRGPWAPEQHGWTRRKEVWPRCQRVRPVQCQSSGFSRRVSYS